MDNAAFFVCRVPDIVVLFRVLPGIQVVENAEEFIEAVGGGQVLIPVAEMILAELARRVAQRLEHLRERGIFLRQALRGTGQAERYVAAVKGVVGDGILGELLAAFGRVRDGAGNDETALETALRGEILSHEKLGPVARHVIKLWYVGTWFKLPQDWHEAFGMSEQDATFVVHPESYTEGLLWPTIGANPSGAKGPGYGTWAEPPRIESANR